MLRLAAAVDCRMMAMCMGFFLDNHIANTSIFSFIALLAANIAKIAHLLFLLMFNALSCFVNYFGFMIHVLALQ